MRPGETAGEFLSDTAAAGLAMVLSESLCQKRHVALADNILHSSPTLPWHQRYWRASTVKSLEPETMMSRFWTRPMATALTQLSWPTRGSAAGSPVRASQTRTISSWEPETMTSRLRVRPMATALTQSLWPTRGPPTGSPVWASQIRTVLSREPETMTSRFPGRPMATALTQSLWPTRACPVDLGGLLPVGLSSWMRTG
jgi:hypothetical protein